MEKIYNKLTKEEIPWNIKEPPKELVNLVEKKIVKPCNTLDLGCGFGNYGIYFASKGFNVTGVDISKTAVKVAKQNAKKKNIKCSFVVANVLKDFNKIKGKFDFIYDWSFLHHIFPQYRKQYIFNIYKTLKSNGCYLSVCFSQKDKHFEGVGKYRKTPLGTELYFSSKKELKALFQEYFYIKELKTIKIKGKFEPHTAIYSFMQKK